MLFGISEASGLVCVAFALIFVPAWGISRIYRYLRDRRTRGAVLAGKKPSRRFVWHSGPAPILIILAGMGVGVWLIGRMNPRQGIPKDQVVQAIAEDQDWRWTALTYGIPILVLCLMLRRSVTWHSDSDLIEADRLSRAGDLEGAIRTLRLAEKDRGTSFERSSSLGNLLAASGRWSESIRHYRDAELLGVEQRKDPAAIMTVRSNLGIAFWKCGRPEEGAALLEEVCRHRRRDIMLIGNYCLVLAAAGRYDSAREQLVLAETLAAARKRPKSEERLKLEEILDECHRRLAKAPIDEV